MTTKSPLQNILKGILHREDENKNNHERMGNIKPEEKHRQVIREEHRISFTHTDPYTKKH
jgi:hypothetical protein